MSTPPDNRSPDTNQEPADLSELTATDALLDRLGSRSASEDDLSDPAAAVLAELVAVIDQSREPDVDAVRLIEVLDGRPLYIAGAEAATDEAPLMIDLTEHEGAASAEVDDEIAASVIAGPREPLVPVTRLPAPSVIPIRVAATQAVGARRWDRALSHAGLPAASVVLLLTIGGGVSAAVTGNPMAPVNGITRVMAQLPGVESSLEKVKTEIRAARRAAARQDAPGVAMHLRNAKARLGDVPASDRSELTEQIAIVENSLAPGSPVATLPGQPGVGDPDGSGSGPGVADPTLPTAVPEPTGGSEPTGGATAPVPTQEPTSDPDPSPTDDSVDPTTDPDPSDSAPTPTIEAEAAEPTSADSTAGP